MTFVSGENAGKTAQPLQRVLQEQHRGGPPLTQLQFRAAPDLLQPAVDALRGRSATW
jgi:hypothetical protein